MHNRESDQCTQYLTLTQTSACPGAPHYYSESSSISTAAACLEGIAIQKPQRIQLWLPPVVRSAAIMPIPKTGLT